MKAEPGDWVLIESHAVGHVVRRGRIVETVGSDGAPPYVVRWTDSDRESTFFPAADARVVTAATLAESDRLERERLQHVQDSIRAAHR